MKKAIKLILLVLISFVINGCFLTPYDNEFKCQPGIIGKCTSSIIDNYKDVIKDMEKKGE